MRPSTSITKPPGARIVEIGIGRDRVRQRDVDLADMVASDRLRRDAFQFAGIDRLLDGDDIGTGFAGADPDQDRIARLQRLVMQPEDPRMQPPVSRGALPT